MKRQLKRDHNRRKSLVVTSMNNSLVFLSVLY